MLTLSLSLSPSLSPSLSLVDFGEWFLWFGQFLLCSSSFFGEGSHEPGAFAGSGFLCALSPIFVYLLLNYVSGVPMLETGADKRWGHEAAYQAYKKETWVFFLLPVSRTQASDPKVADQQSNPAVINEP